jgi:hypothetical protein
MQILNPGGLKHGTYHKLHRTKMGNSYFQKKKGNSHPTSYNKKLYDAMGYWHTRRLQIKTEI